MDLGRRASSSPSQLRRLRTTNVSALLGALVIGSWAPVTLLMDAPLVAANNAVGALLFCTVLLLNRAHKPSLASLALILVTHIECAVSLGLFGYGSGTALFYVVLIIAPYMMFASAVRWVAHLCAAMSGLAWIAATALRDELPRRVEVLGSHSHLLANTVLVVFAIIGLGWAIASVVERAEDDFVAETARSDALLLNVLPPSIAAELKQNPGAVIARRYDEVSVLFADLVGFTQLSAKTSAERTVELLNEVFTAFDAICDRAGVEKIRTIGDGYMAASGAPKPREDHALSLTRVAIEMRDYMDALETEEKLQIRIGINSGEAVAAIVGTSRFHYDLWGDAVNIAARMESMSEPGRIHIGPRTWELVHEQIPCEARGPLSVKGRGVMETWFVV